MYAAYLYILRAVMPDQPTTPWYPPRPRTPVPPRLPDPGADRTGSPRDRLVGQPLQRHGLLNLRPHRAADRPFGRQ
jgi:hypothetical protein